MENTKSDRRGAYWWGLMVGNSRYHWGLFDGQGLRAVFHFPLVAPHRLQAWQDGGRSPFDLFSFPAEVTPAMAEGPIFFASVVPAQTVFWQIHGQECRLGQLPLTGLYGSLGIDRALALLGAGITYGFPCLVIDGGTALTVNGGVPPASFRGGAILPGMALQFQSLGQHTGALPTLDAPADFPTVWGQDTPTAIASGVVRGMVATVTHFITQWHQEFPHSPVVFTGGDGAFFHHHCGRSLSGGGHHDPQLIFTGLRAVRSGQEIETNS